MPKKAPFVPPEVLFDECDRALIEPYFWWTDKAGYAMRWEGSGSTRRPVRMHRAILQAKPGELVDHINGNTSDNRRANIRIVSHGENLMNRVGRNALNTSGYRGVYLAKRYSHKWRGAVTIGGKQKSLGRSDDPLFLAALVSTYRTLYVSGATS